MQEIFTELEDEIISIEFIGKKETIDISVSGNRLFYANGILTHNSGYSETIPGMDSMAGGISKAYTADLGIHINNTQQLRSKGILEFQLTKTRNSGGVGKILELSYDVDTLRITDLVQDAESGEMIDAETGEIKQTSKDTVQHMKNLLSKIKK